MNKKYITKTETLEDLRHTIQLAGKYAAQIKDKLKSLEHEVQESIENDKKKQRSDK